MQFNKDTSKEARKMLGLDLHEVDSHEKSWLSKWENGVIDPQYSTVDRLYNFFKERGIRFREGGVMLVTQMITESQVIELKRRLAALWAKQIITDQEYEGLLWLAEQEHLRIQHGV